MHTEFLHVHGPVGTHVGVVITGLPCSLSGIKNFHCAQLGLRFLSLVGARVKRCSPQALQSFGNLLSVREIRAKSCIPGSRLP